jgi:hypothetical protein
MTRTLVPLLALLAGCKRPEVSSAPAADPPPAQLASEITAANPDHAVQLLRGFYPVEGNAWRWTMGKFAFALRPPEGAAAKGGVLKMRFGISAAVLGRMGPLTVNVTAGGQPLGAETFGKPGDAVYQKDVPAALLAGESLTFEVAVEKPLPPTGADQRELAVVFNAASLSAKP